jgi:hypothetical protein
VFIQHTLLDRITLKSLVVINTPLTSGINALLQVSEDSLDYHENSGGQPNPSNYNSNTKSQAEKFSFDDHSNNNYYNDLGDDYNFSLDCMPNQTTLQDLYQVSTDVNDFFIDSDGISYNESLTSFMFQAPSNTISTTFRSFDGAQGTILYGSDTGYENPAAANLNLAQASRYVPCVSRKSLHVPSQQPQYRYDGHGNLVSPLQMMNEQYDLQSKHNRVMDADPNLSFLVRALPLTDNVPHHYMQPSKLLLTQPQQRLISPPPQSPQPAHNPGDSPVKVKRRRRRKPPPPPELAAAKHKAFLQRNREAASKCRTKKKVQINDLEDEERMGQQVNAVLKDEFRDILGEVLLLREQVKEMLCDEGCEGCGKHGPMRRDSVLAISSIGTNSIHNGHNAQRDEEEEEEDEASGSTSLQNPLSFDTRFETFALNNEVVNVATQAQDYPQNTEGTNARQARDDHILRVL